ncbi:hypothetical protein CAPTEDRAFT_225805 [Capitella teleta]|uniref:ADF-H domain-containing protein n=1 Tax=Capitella teleta TaxID=283909 RepID=R7VLE9_CAPTE|nr:hypothetical protein CAPTEDRAFT_225805 [Capitella teleta]|eukprot:ELU18186.1 hypothetical protein CAPTEDRAFT_225805 [Capitella teleta]
MKIKIHPDVMMDYEMMKSKRQHKYSIYTVKEEVGSRVVVMERVVMGDNPTTEDDIEALFRSEMPALECRYVMLNLRVISTHQCQVDKFVLLIWCPSEGEQKELDLYYSCRNVFRKEMTGVAREYIVNHPNDVSFKQIIQDVGSE